MARKSRRLPGGKVRKLPAGGTRPRSLGTTESDLTTTADTGLVGRDLAGRTQGYDPAAVDAPLRAAGRLVSAAARTPAMARPAPVVRSGRVGVSARPAAVASRRGPSLMDQAIVHTAYIRRDLVRIGILAATMFAIIVALSFILK